MRGQGNEIGDGERDFARPLRAVGEQQRAGFADNFGDLIDRLDDARFVVHLLDRDQGRAGLERTLQRVEIDDPPAIHRHDGRFRSHFVRDDRMLGRTDNPAGDLRTPGGDRHGLAGA